MAAIDRAVLLLTLLWTPARGDTVISCDLKKSCMLPCRFQAGDEKVIHWIQEKPVKAQTHSYYYKKNQLALQSQRFKSRTSLFLDQLSTGNASLQLRGVEAQDEGSYRCYTSTSNGHDQSIVSLHVDAQVREVSVNWTGNRMTCSSDWIYPEPVLTWSTDPSSTIARQYNTTVKITEEHLYNITSSLMLPDSDEGLNYSCNISTRSSWRKITLRQQSLLNMDHAKIPCHASSVSFRDFSLIWSFNHSQIIVNRSRTNVTKVSDQWKQRVKEVSESGDLFLQGLKPDQGGIFTCELRQAGKAHLTETVLRITKDRPTPNIGGIITGVLLVCLPLIFIWGYYKNQICATGQVKNACHRSKKVCMDCLT
uniref:Ig-like domain-containing protein n=1 Tax=Salarias fasciatus TaxID=181472 RepID=A0A672GDC7_SALFA